MENRIREIFLFGLVVSVVILMASCERVASKYEAVDGSNDEQELANYKEQLKEWDKKRVDYILSPNGWINVRGLFWLKDGINSFGSAKENDVIFPAGKIAAKAGFFILKDTVVTMQLLPNVKVAANNIEVKSLVIFHPDSAKAKVLSAGSLQWFVIKRGNKVGIRLRDLATEKLNNFSGIERYEANLKWKVKATMATQLGKTIDMIDVLGQVNRNPVKATVSFLLDGQTYSLEALDDDGKLFIIFGDQTNSLTTYGSGRYLYASVPESGNDVYLDFNQAINPPCAFTEFATCLLPSPQNILPIKIEAGEKAYHH